MLQLIWFLSLFERFSNCLLFCICLLFLTMCIRNTKNFLCIFKNELVFVIAKNPFHDILFVIGTKHILWILINANGPVWIDCKLLMWILWVLGEEKCANISCFMFPAIQSVIEKICIEYMVSINENCHGILIICIPKSNVLFHTMAMILLACCNNSFSWEVGRSEFHSLSVFKC